MWELGSNFIMAKPYVPPGYIGLIDAAKTIAAELCPDRWEKERIPEAEALVWDGLEISLSPELIETHLQILVKDKSTEIIDRYCDFRDAQKLLRDALISGKITGSYFDDEGKPIEITRNWWAAPVAEDMLCEGMVLVDEGDVDTVVTRYILIPKKLIKLAEICRVDDADIPTTEGVGGPVVTYKTGAAGRPTSIPLILSEARKRIVAQEYFANQEAFFDRLGKWLSEVHPGAALPSAKTMKNNPDLRNLWRSYKATRSRFSPDGPK